MSYYDELGVSPNASDEEIRAAFRRKAKKYHPDKSGGDPVKMAQTNRAYETLSSPQRRIAYDRTGEDKPQAVDVLAHEIVLKNILEWLQAENTSGNLVGDITTRLNAEQLAFSQQIENGTRMLLRLEKRLTKLKFRGKGQDMIRLSVNYRTTQIKQELEKLLDKVAQLDRAKEMLALYEYEMDQIIVPTYTTFTQFFNTGTGS